MFVGEAGVLLCHPILNFLPPLLHFCGFSLFFSGDYSTAYDDWCTAEEAHNASLPENKRKDYKLTTEKMKKFDEMITEFPKRLATPIDATYLRAAVRRVRSNKARQEKRKSSGSAASETLKQRQTVTEKVVVNISVPQKGSEFELVSFNRQDFQE